MIRTISSMSKVRRASNDCWWINLKTLFPSFNNKSLLLQILEDFLDQRTIMLWCHDGIISLNRKIYNIFQIFFVLNKLNLLENHTFLPVKLRRIICINNPNSGSKSNWLWQIDLKCHMPRLHINLVRSNDNCLNRFTG